MEMSKTYTFPQHGQYGTAFALVRTHSGTYVCPGWHLVPDGTTRDQIKFEASSKSSPKKTAPSAPKSSREWQVEASKPGKFYTVSELNGQWDCTCPAKTFHRGDCKHIKAKKSEKVLA
jgi:hypothetical protein